MTNEHSDRAPSSIRDDSICESSLPPNKSSGDIGERLEHAYAIAELDNLAPWFLAVLSESAAEIERLRREVEEANLKVSSFEMGAYIETINNQNDRIAHAYLQRALTAESAVAAAYENAAKIADLHASSMEEREADSNEQFHDGRDFACESIASAIRAVSKKTAESGHSPSTHNSESE